MYGTNFSDKFITSELYKYGYHLHKLYAVFS